MELSKIRVGLLEGKTNWATWKYKILVILRGQPKALKVIEGKHSSPIKPPDAATAEVLAKYEKELEEFQIADSDALLVISNNLTEETLKKVMRFTTAREVWLELHRLFDGVSEDKAYDICLEFFSYQRQPEDDIGTHLSKLKNLWNELKVEISKDGIGAELPELFLICKILGTLPESFFAFRSSWMLMAKRERTVENLTNQLCAHEHALKGRDGGHASDEVLTTTVKKSNMKIKKKPMKADLVCHYCQKPGHMTRKCKKWISDGRPAPNFSKTASSNSALVSKHEHEPKALLTTKSSFLTVGNDEKSWYVDNGATNHITNQRDIFQEFSEFKSSHDVMTADGTSIRAIGSGTIPIESNVSGKWEKLLLKDVWYIPGIKKNLFSPLAAQDHNRNSEFVAHTEECFLTLENEVVIVGNRKHQGGLYKLAIRHRKCSKPSEVNSLCNQNTLQLYHERFGHQNKRHIKKFLEREMGIKVNLDDELCEACVFGKSHRLKFGSREKSTMPGQLIHTDVGGPFFSSISGYRFYVLFKDDYSKFRKVYFMKQKSEVAQHLRSFLNETKTQGLVVRELLSYNGGEFVSTEVKNVLNEFGIRHRTSMPFTPQQNGAAERENRTLVEMARTLMHAREELPQGLWAELVNTAAYILNRTSPSREDDKTPYEIWYGTKPRVHHLRIIGTTCYAHIPKPQRTKFQKKARKGILIGYDGDEGYRIWCQKNLQLIRSRDVIFNEEPLTTEDIATTRRPDPQQLNEFDCAEPTESTPSPPQLEQSTPTDSDSSSVFHGWDNASVHSDEEEDIEGQDENRRVLRDRSTLKSPERYGYLAMTAAAEIHDIWEPSSYSEAINCEDKIHWQRAMDSEIKSLKENNTWRLEHLPKGKKAIPCRWTFRVKLNPDGSIDKYKARVVAKGFTQKKGSDYDEVFSPVARSGTIRAVLSVAAAENLHMMQFDVSTAFLYGNLDETIYMQQPDGFNDETGRVCRLTRSLYGLKQAPRCWNKRFVDYLSKIGLHASEADPCLFIREKDGKKLIVALYVDDGLVASNCKLEQDNFIEELKREFKITTKEASYFLGLEIEKQEGQISVKQTAYTRKLLERFGMADCRPVGTPMLKDRSQLTKEEEKEDVKNFPYRQIVGSLMYLMVGTRPDISYAVGVVCRALDNPTKIDCVNVKRILRYLKGTPDLGLVYKSKLNNGRIYSYSDADLGGDETTGRSTTGVVNLFCGAAISWTSQRQVSVALSSTEAEIVAASEAAKELVWLHRLLTSMTKIEDLPVLYVDNEAAIRLAKNPENHRRTKHIKIRHFFVRELVMNGEIIIAKVETSKQLADAMTKALHQPRLSELRQKIGMSHHQSDGR
ncbi:unnamed protein product, partial [Nesidiocoris tenuis]